MLTTRSYLFKLQTLKYQIVLATDYITTYVMYLYEDSMCDWIKTLQQITRIGDFIEIHVGYAIAGQNGNNALLKQLFRNYSSHCDKYKF